MTMTRLAVGIAATLLATGCATRDPMPFAAGTDCFYPACSIDVEVVDDGSGGKKLQVAGDGNVRMGTRHRLVAIVWKLRTPGYEFRGDSIRPYTGRAAGGPSATNTGVWDSQILPHPYAFDTYSVTDHNNERVTLAYNLRVYPSSGTPGTPLAITPTIANDSVQGVQHGWLMLK